jgi:glutaryl-CoA dehydrogenase
MVSCCSPLISSGGEVWKTSSKAGRDTASSGGAMGAAHSAFQSALEYSSHRTQFGKPISGFQLTQAKLAGMAIELTNGTLLALHLGRRKDVMGLRPEQVSMGKLNNVNKALEICRTSRTILGANGISSEYPVMRRMSNLESVLTYEGTPEMHTLMIGHALTGSRRSVNPSGQWA